MATTAKRSEKLASLSLAVACFLIAQVGCGGGAPFQENRNMPSDAESQVTQTMDWTLDRYAWSHRPVVVFADEGDDRRWVVQRQLLDEASAGLDERQMVVVTVIGEAVTAAGRAVQADAAALRKRLDVPAGAGFAVVLVGKDGGVKRRGDGPVDPAALFALVDTMPMRRAEMRGQE